MKTLLDYINWALHDFNHFVWSSLWLNIRLHLFSAVVIIIPFALYIVIGDAVFLVLIIYFPAVFWLTISYLIKRESEKAEIMEVENQFGLKQEMTTVPSPITWKEALQVGSWWVYYTALVFMIATVLIIFFNEPIKILFEWMLS